MQAKNEGKRGHDQKRRHAILDAGRGDELCAEPHTNKTDRKINQMATRQGQWFAAEQLLKFAESSDRSRECHRPDQHAQIYFDFMDNLLGAR